MGTNRTHSSPFTKYLVVVFFSPDPDYRYIPRWGAISFRISFLKPA
nr:MAG TPA: hypothetical protein [Caudoviricetes sp.]